jgi:cyclopropane fatty-acyl-phospholipid synthase-like methyltransferase
VYALSAGRGISRSPGPSRTVWRRELEALYRTHPISEPAILARLRDQRRSLTRITETDLAGDPHSETTDQNHIGGAVFTKELAERAGVSREIQLLDLGCGLGGSARYLASRFGCRVHGIDLSAKRCREARHLTKLVGLEHLVTVQCGDVSTIALPTHRFDVLWGQSAWVHIQNKEQFIGKWAAALKPSGRIAFEEAYVKRRAENVREAGELAELSACWKAYLINLKSWTAILNRCGFRVCSAEDLSPQLSADYAKMSRLVQTGVVSGVPKSELRAWRLALALAKTGIVGYIRIIGKKDRRKDNRFSRCVRDTTGSRIRGKE